MEKPDTKTMGRGMMIGAWVLALLLLSLFFKDLLERDHNPNQEVASRITGHGAREVTLQRNRYGHYVTSGAINGRPVVFLLDTGATTVSIPDTIARRLQLKRGFPYSVSTANGTIEVYGTRLQQLRIGDIELADVQAHINPHMEDEGILLGMSVLKQLELVQRGDTLTLRQYTSP